MTKLRAVTFDFWHTLVAEHPGTLRRMQLEQWGRLLARAGQPREDAEFQGDGSVEFVLWLIAVILVIAGIVALLRGGIVYGIVLIIVGLLVGPGGVSIFT